jgi:hypothetical protein
MLAVGTGVMMAVKLHVAFALGWMLTSYVAIGLFETLIGLSRRLRRGRREPTEDPLNSSSS